MRILVNKFSPTALKLYDKYCSFGVLFIKRYSPLIDVSISMLVNDCIHLLIH